MRSESFREQAVRVGPLIGELMRSNPTRIFNVTEFAEQFDAAHVAVQMALGSAWHQDKVKQISPDEYRIVEELIP